MTLTLTVVSSTVTNYSHIWGAPRQAEGLQPQSRRALLKLPLCPVGCLLQQKKFKIRITLTQKLVAEICIFTHHVGENAIFTLNHCG